MDEFNARLIQCASIERWRSGDADIMAKVQRESEAALKRRAKQRR